MINLILAGFNLLPAAPLDGGSVLAALIWSRSGRQSTGKIWAARSGVAVGLAMVWWGLKDMGTNDGIGLWILMVGAFIAMNAWQSLRAAPLFALVEGVRVADAMYADPPTARASDTVADFLRSLPRDTHHQSYPVIGDHGRVTGVLTANAIRAVPSSQWEALRTVDELIAETESKFGVTSIVISHDMASVFRIADQLTFMHFGEVIVSGPPAEVIDQLDDSLRDFIDASGVSREFIAEHARGR